MGAPKAWKRTNPRLRAQGFFPGGKFSSRIARFRRRKLGSERSAIELSIGAPSVGHPLPARNEWGGWGEGKSNKNTTPLPGPLLLLRRKRGRRARSIPLIQVQWGQSVP